jgi:hypothetical protein
MIRLVIFALFFVFVNVAYAQNALPAAPLGSFISGTTQATLSVSSTSNNVALPIGDTADMGSVLIWNTGKVPVRINLGNASVIAPGSLRLTIAPNCFIAVAEGGATYIAGIADSQTTLELFGGHGLPSSGCLK